MPGELKIEITEGEIRNAVAVALSESFSPEKKDALIRNIVRAHLEQKDRNSYSDQTILDKAVGETLRSEAQAQLVARLNEMRPKIAEIVRKHLGEKFETSVYNQLESSLKGLSIGSMVMTCQLERD